VVATSSPISAKNRSNPAGQRRRLVAFGTGHAAHDRVDAGISARDLVDVQPAPCDAVVANAHGDDAALVERRAVGLGPGPVDLDQDGVGIDRRSHGVRVEVRDRLEQRRPVAADLVDPLERPGREQRLLAAVVLVEAGEHRLEVVRVLRCGQPVQHRPRVAHRTSIRHGTQRP